MTTEPDPPSTGRRTRRHALRQRLERTADLYLRECYDRRTAARADEYARKLELTPQYLRRRVNDAFGTTIRQFLRSRQLAYAERLLRTTSYSTVEIAVMSGFGTRPTLYRAFKRMYGMTPGQFREHLRDPR